MEEYQVMFNKKKRNWFQNKPHYKRGDGPGDNNNNPGQNPVKPVPTPAGVNTAAEVFDMPLPKELTPDKPEPDTLVNPVNCAICQMPIRNHYTAIRHKESGSLAHFDCVLRDLSKENYSKLGRFKKIYYIGAGNFAIVKEIFDKRGHFKSYEVLEKIVYEAKEK
jgi:hypothetical protein